MRRRTLLAACATGLAGLAGCQSTANGNDGQQSPDGTRQSPDGSASGDGGTPTDTDAVTPTPTKADRERETAPSTETRTATERPDVSVEYEILAGEIPDGLRSLGVTLQVVFVDDTDEMTACLRETYTGPYKPTITPIPTPTSGACHRSQEFAFDLTEFEYGPSLGPVTAPGAYAAGHALVVTDVTATTTDGGTAAVEGTGGHRANVVEGRPDGPYHVELGLEAAPSGASYDYDLVSSLIEPAN